MNKIVKLIIASISVLVLLFLIKTFDLYYPLYVVTTTRSSELSVVGEGKVDVVPDTAYVDAGISVVEGNSVPAVQKTIDDINNKIIAALKKLGIDKKDIQTSQYSINPNYSYENNRQGITGYNGNANITIKVKRIDMVSQVISEVTAAGANTIQGARFEVASPEKYREQAREKAIANAKEQAQKLAKSLGIKLGNVTNIIESSGGMPIPYYDKALAMSERGLGGGGGPNIEPGSQTITSVVTLYFEKR